MSVNRTIGPTLVFFHTLQITDDVASVVIAQLLYLQSESTKKPVHMYINSPGDFYVLFKVFTFKWCIFGNS